MVELIEAVGLVLATGTVTFASSWGVIWLKDRRKFHHFKKILAVEVELNTLECARIIKFLRPMAKRGMLDRAKIEPFPFKSVVFEAFKGDFRSLNRDMLQKALIFYSRLHEANRCLDDRWIEMGADRADLAKLALETIRKAFKEGEALMGVLKPRDPVWGKVKR